MSSNVHNSFFDHVRRRWRAAQNRFAVNSPICRTCTGTTLFLLLDDASTLLFLIESLADIAYAAIIDFGNVTSRDASGAT